MRELIALLSLTVTACGPQVSEDFQPPRQLTWRLASGPAEFWQDHGMGEGSLLWSDLGVEVTRTKDVDADVAVVLVNQNPRSGFAAWTSFLDDGTALIEVYASLDPAALAPVFAHELGHVILPGSGEEDHLPLGAHGIMGAYVEGRDWSDADLRFLHRFGLPAIAE